MRVAAIAGSNASAAMVHSRLLKARTRWSSCPRLAAVGWGPGAARGAYGHRARMPGRRKPGPDRHEEQCSLSASPWCVRVPSRHLE